MTDNTSGNGHALTGICFQSKYLAIGYFSPNDSSELRFIGCDKIVLEIPEGALPGTDPQLVYMYLEMYEDNISTMSPRVNCGPDGLRFQVNLEPNEFCFCIFIDPHWLVQGFEPATPH